MFRGMRRERQELSEAETIAMLKSCTSGVLAVHGDDDYPCAVPLGFTYEDGKLFFHSAKAGHKMDAIERNEKVSFCVIAADEVVQSEFTDSEKRHALECLAKKYSPDYFEAADSEIEHAWERVCVIELAIEHMTGKAAIEIIEERAETQTRG